MEDINSDHDIKLKCVWEVEETKLFLKICLEQNILKQIDKKSLKQTEVFKPITAKLQEHGYEKTPKQAQLKFKSLKLKYYTEKKKSNRSGSAGCKFIYMNLLRELFENRPKNTAASEYGVDSSEQALTPTLSNQSPTHNFEHNLDESSNVLEIGNTIPESEELIDNTNRSSSRNNIGGRSKYEKVISSFTDKMAKQQNELQENLFKKQDELFEKQKALELELQDREDERQKTYLESLATIFNPRNNSAPYQRPFVRRMTTPVATRTQFIEQQALHQQNNDVDQSYEEIEYLVDYE